MINRNFPLEHEQAEWLREQAFLTKRSQAEMVREALDEYRAKTESADASERNRALVDRFTKGEGIDLAVLRDADGAMWRRDA